MKAAFGFKFQRKQFKSGEPVLCALLFSFCSMAETSSAICRAAVGPTPPLLLPACLAHTCTPAPHDGKGRRTSRDRDPPASRDGDFRGQWRERGSSFGWERNPEAAAGWGSRSRWVRPCRWSRRCWRLSSPTWASSRTIRPRTTWRRNVRPTRAREPAGWPCWRGWRTWPPPRRPTTA